MVEIKEILKETEMETILPDELKEKILKNLLLYLQEDST